MKNIVGLSLILICFFVTTSAVAVTDSEITAALESRWIITKRSFLTGDVKKPGTVLVIQKPGIRANLPKVMNKPTVIINGDITGMGGGNVLGGNSGHPLKPGDRMFLYDVQSRANSFILILGTVDTFDISKDGSTVARPYQAALEFTYDEGLGNIDLAKVLADINIWVKSESDSAAFTVNTVRIGHTPEEVVQILGVPEKKVDLGSKQIFIYRDMNVVFIEGKVSDVQ